MKTDWFQCVVYLTFLLTTRHLCLLRQMTMLLNLFVGELARPDMQLQHVFRLSSRLVNLLIENLVIYTGWDAACVTVQVAVVEVVAVPAATTGAVAKVKNAVWPRIETKGRATVMVRFFFSSVVSIDGCCAEALGAFSV